MRFLLHAWCVQPLFDEWQPTIERGRTLVTTAEPVARIGLAGEPDALPMQTQIR